MLERVLTQLFQKMNPGRKAIAKRVGNRLVFVTQDSAGCNDYLLEGTYTYDEVVKLNELTTYNAGFGFCKEIGPVAFIGIPNPAYASGSGYFRYKVRTYGSPTDESECYFEAYDEEEAKEISNYTVYGLLGHEAVAEAASIAELNYVSDSRYKAKESREPRVFSMDCKLKEKYTYAKAKVLATGSVEDIDGYGGEDHPIVIAEVEGGQHVGIINMWECDIKLVRGFRDVWEYGADQPEVKQIRFLEKDEAMNINDYTLYVYSYSCAGLGRVKYPIEKCDRTLDPRFNFHLPDGTDYRLVEHEE